MIANLQKTVRPRVPRWHAGFFAMLPAIAAHARIAFRHRGPEAHEDAVAECIAGALVSYVRLYELGKIELAYPSVLARYAAAHVRTVPVPDIVCFRLDFAEQLRRLPIRNRRIAESLAIGNQTQEFSRRFGVSEGRIAQLRRELAESWVAFRGEEGASAKIDPVAV